MIPERLVSIREYDYASLADDDLKRLEEAGIPAYLREVWTHGSRRWHRDVGAVELRVPESAVESARALLPEEPPRLLDSADRLQAQLRCPHCGSSSTIARPPYALIPLLAGLAIGAWFAANDDTTSAFSVVASAIAIVAYIEWRIPKWRCNVCGKTWSSD